jgi:hypothetical protein
LAIFEYWPFADIIMVKFASYGKTLAEIEGQGAFGQVYMKFSHY